MASLSLSPIEVYYLLGLFGLVMVGLVRVCSGPNFSFDGFLVADRNLSTWGGAFSIAVSWVWAPAVFICSLQAYTKGLPGVFWFTAPNVLCFFTFAFVAVRLRELMPDGYSLPDYIWSRFGGHKAVHLAFLVIAFGYQFGAIIINAVAGGTLLHLASGIDVRVAMGGMIVVSLAYSLLGGLKASVFTDIIQMLMILVFGFILVPWVIIESGGWGSVQNGLAGISGEYGDVFNPAVAFAFGIPMSVSLIAGPISDQMFYQRSMAVQRDNIVKVFVRGGLLFSLVPIVLSLLGFVGVTLVHSRGLMIDDPQMVAPQVIAFLLPKFAMCLFILMAFAGLCSTMDSAFCGMSALGSVDIYRRYLRHNPKDENLLKAARLFMIGGALIGGVIALLKPQLLWVFFIQGALVSAGLVPVLTALFWCRVGANGLFTAILVSICVSVPLSVYANVSGDDRLIVLASVAGVIVSAVICLFFGVFAPVRGKS